MNFNINIETIIAEKFETFISDNIMNTRTKDFYDLYMLLTKYYSKIDKNVLVKAIKNTFKRRETDFDVEKIIYSFNKIKESERLKFDFYNILLYNLCMKKPVYPAVYIGS